MTRALGIRGRLVVSAIALIAGFSLATRAFGVADPDLLLTIVAALVGAAIAVAATSVITRPLRALADAAKTMASGDLTARAHEQDSRELGELSDALNQLASSAARSIDALSDERDRLASILDGMSEGVLVVDSEARIALANPALRSMAMIGADAVGQSVLSIFRSAPLQAAIVAARRSKGGSQTEGDATCEIEVGGVVPRRLLVRVSKLKTKAREGDLIAVMHDVTELRHLETIRTDFVANVSHELRTPVTAISTAAETLQAGALGDPDDAAEFVGVIERHAVRLRHLVDDLLDLSKIEAKSFHLKRSALDVGAVVADSVRLIEDEAKRRDVRITIVSGAELPLARGDRRALEQVVFNLIDNAVKYAGEGALVTVSSELTGEHVFLTIADTGPGIARQHLGRIFERFYRVDAGRSRDLGGTGLGLSIVKHLVESMGGAIEVESELGKGTRFRIRLPRAA